MSRYVVEDTSREGEALVVLRDTAGGAVAQLWPGCGNNCFSLTLPAPAGSDATRAGEPVTVIQDPPQLDEIRRRPSWWGIPLLFPFPGVIPKGEYRFEGKQYRLGRPEQPIISEGHETPGARRDYHGFVMDLPWKVVSREADDHGATVTSRLNSWEHPETMEGFPFPFGVEATYRLDAAGLRLHFRASNPGPGRLPFGFGAHPFFKLPLGERGSAAECLVCIPAANRYNAQAIRAAMNGTGPMPSPDEAKVPVPPELDLRAPRPFVEKTFNGMFNDLAPVADAHGAGGAAGAAGESAGAAEAFVRDPTNGLETVMRASREFPNVVLWSPPGRSELCFEPWTCPSNVFNLAAHGVPHNGLVVLEPGESWSATMWISLRSAPSEAPAARSEQG